LSRNRAVIAAAGARKTQEILDEALALAPRRVLITTYTNENLRQIERRIVDATGVIPDHIHLASWFGFLLRDGVKPYQSSVLPRERVVRGLNFLADRPPYTRSDSWQFFLDNNYDVWRDAMADLVRRIQARTEGAVTARLASVYDHVYVDEVQDLVGYDLDVLDAMFAAPFDVTVVGDPRQHLYATNNATRNKRYRGPRIVDWFAERDSICVREDRHQSHRCNQDICDFATALFPDYPPISSVQTETTGHDGIHIVSRFEALDYADTYKPQVLRYDKRADTQGLPAMNFGVSKGSTFDRVLIYPTTPMRQYLQDRDASRLKRPESLYVAVAVTRARYSVAFVV
jgi:DNA helicase-2/ATP-dependent DNA helicase PcrA